MGARAVPYLIDDISPELGYDWQAGIGTMRVQRVHSTSLFYIYRPGVMKIPRCIFGHEPLNMVAPASMAIAGASRTRSRMSQKERQGLESVTQLANELNLGLRMIVRGPRKRIGP